MGEDYVIVKGRKHCVTDRDTLDLSDYEITDISEDIEGLESLHWLRGLIFGYDKITEINGLENLTNLERLYISSNQIKEIKGLDNLSKLKTLSLGNNEIQEITGVEDLMSLKSLELSGNKITEIKGLKRLGNLQYLGLGYDAFSDPYDEEKRRNQITELKGLDTLTNLKKLNLDGNQITEIKGLEKLNNLKNINLKYNPIREDELYLIDKSAQEIVKYCQYKKEGEISVRVKGKKYYVFFSKSLGVSNSLDLSNKEITDIREIVGLEKLAYLEGLFLSFNQIAEIHGLDHLSSLQSLKLNKNKITEIKGLEHLTNLQKIDLSGNLIRDEEKHLIGIGLENAQDIVRYNQDKKEDKLEFVMVKGKPYYVLNHRLSLTKLGIVDIYEIKGLENLTHLEYLDLRNNQITEVKGLEHLINLKELHLEQNPLKEDEWKIAFEKRYDRQSGLVFERTKDAQTIVKYSQKKARKAQEGG